MQGDIQSLVGKNHACACGREHRVSTRHITVECGLTQRLPSLISEWGLPLDIMLVADTSTWEVQGRSLADAMRGAGFGVRTSVLPAKHLHADASSIGQLLLASEPQPGMLLAVGSGTVNDLTRYVAHRTGCCYAVVGTAPSMDGYASNVVPVLRGGVKVTFPGVAPVFVAADLDVLCAAPDKMVAAGFGDVLGKRTARLDWLLARDMEGEYHCPWVAGLAAQAVKRCLDSVEGLVRREPQAMAGLMEALTLTGITIQMCNQSRPASGAEHHIAHFLEMRDALLGKPPALHGDKVGMASLLVMRLTEKFFMGEPPRVQPMPDESVWRADFARAYGALAEGVDREGDPWGCLHPADWHDQRLRLLSQWEFYRAEAAALPALRAEGERAIRALGGGAAPAELGYDRAVMLDALRYAFAIRPHKLTVLRLLAQWGKLEDYAREVLDELDT